MDETAFRERLDVLANAWAARDYPRAAAMFAEDVIYIDPLRYRMSGRESLLRFFQDDDDRPQHTVWHVTLFDEVNQHGAAEYSYAGTHAYHGVVLIALDRDGRFHRWREYQHIVEAAWADWWQDAVHASPATN